MAQETPPPMFSMTSLLATLPPASLAESDLPRFVTRAFGRRLPSELPGLRALFDEEPLTGYPPALGALLAAAAERLAAEGVDPGALDPQSAERVLASSAFLRAVERRTPMDRQLLRPGEILTTALREMLGASLHVLPGSGPQLALVAPVGVVHLPGVRYSIPRGPVLARAMNADEADRVRLAWGAVEEAFAADDPGAAPWHARFVVIASRPNHDATAAAAGLAALPASRRARVWAELLEHLRDQEVIEEHRPGTRGLSARLGRLGIAADTPWVAPLIALAELAWDATGLDAEVVRGHVPCTRDDVETFCGWVEVPIAWRDALRALEPPEITRQLQILADIESGRLDVAFPQPLVRPLRTLRDQLLRPRYRRAAVALEAADPLALAEGRVACGADRDAILKALEALADAAGAAAASRPAVTLSLTRDRDLDGFELPADDRDLPLAPPGRAEPAPSVSTILTDVARAATRGPGPMPASAPPAAEHGAMASREAFGGAGPASPPSPASPRSREELPNAPGATPRWAGALGPSAAFTADPTPGARGSVDASPAATAPAAPGPPAPAPAGATANPYRVPPPFVEGVRPPRFALPPLPEPPPQRPRPRTRPRSEFPPMPSGPLPPLAGATPLVNPERVRAATEPRSAPVSPIPDRPLPAPMPRGERPSTSPSTARTDAPASRADTLAPRAAPAPPGDRADAAPPPQRERPATVPAPPQRPRTDARAARRGAADALVPATTFPIARGGDAVSVNASVSADRRRPPTAPHLVTPRQGNAFYDAAFKELELLERDLLRRGPWRAASERVEALEHEALELASALGPSARSGDKEFSAALRRVEMVQAYLDRIAPLLSGDRPDPDATHDDAPAPRGLRRLFGRRK